MKVLILGGTQDARALADQITTALPDVDVMTSLAGATKSRAKISGDVRVGGFGGVTGLVDYLTTQSIDAVIDATHPYATQMTDHGVEACAQAHVEYLCLERPQWILPTNTDVIFVPDAVEAARLIARTSRSAFLTIGRKDLTAFEGLDKVKLLIRSIEALSTDHNFNDATIITARPPFDVEAEIKLMRAHEIDTLVSKASGGDATRAKIDAAAHLDARIVLLRRPPPPKALRVFNVRDALTWLTEQRDTETNNAAS